MNNIKATITEISNVKNLHIVKFDFFGSELFMMSLELNNVSVGTNVLLSVKSTAVSLAKDFSGFISLSNQLDVVISDIEIGELLCCIKLKIHDAEFDSIITTKMFKKMDLQVGMSVKMLIKASALAIKELL